MGPCVRRDDPLRDRARPPLYQRTAEVGHMRREARKIRQLRRHVYSTWAAPAAIVLAFGRRFGPWLELGCVLRTASVSISRSSALVLVGSRVYDFCHCAIDNMWERRRQK